MKNALVFTLAVLIYEYQTGMTKQCVYESYKGQHTITINNYQLCPLNIRV